MESLTIKKIAHIENGFKEKFGIPRQSGLVSYLSSEIVFEDEFCDQNAFRGIEDYSHLWMIWGFSDNNSEGWSPTVRPPRLGGNKRVGVFATRSPFRPNPLGLSSVKLEKVVKENGRIKLIVSGADLLDGTPIFDIKPYLPFTDSHPDAIGGFSDEVLDKKLEVRVDEKLEKEFDAAFLQTVKELVSQDPRPAYIENEDRVYKFSFSGKEITFCVEKKTAFIKEIEDERK